MSAANAPRLNKVQHQGTAAYSKVTLRLSGVPIVKPYWSTTGVSVVLEGAELSRGLPAKVNVQSRIVRRVRTGLSNLGSPYVAIDAVPGITLKTEVVVDRATVVLTIHPAEADRHHIDLVVSGRTPPAGPVVRLTGVRSIERDRGRRIEFTFTAPPRIQEVRTNDKFIMRFPAVMADRNVPERVKTSWPLAPLLLLENGPKGLKAELALTGSSSVQCVASVRGNSVDVLLTETAALNPTRRPKTESAADSVAVMTSSERFPSPRPSERLLLASNGATPYTRLNDGTPLPFPPSPSQLLVLLRSEHLRVKLNSDIERIAVGDPSLLHAEPIGTRELLLLGKGWGRSSLIVWFRNKQVAEYRVWVQRDMTLLRTALKRLNQNIEIDVATDRDAVVLMGTVPDLATSQAAVRLAQNYLDATSKEDEVWTKGGNGPNANSPTAGKESATGSSDQFRVPAKVVRGGGIVLNMLRLENLPTPMEEKLSNAVAASGTSDVRIRRVMRGDLPDDTKDVFVLEGSVRTQVELVRVLLLASQMVSGQAANPADLRVVADEAGGLLTAGGGASAGGSGTGGGGGMGAGGGGGASTGGAGLLNQVGRNLARAKAIEVAQGRILSFLKVEDLPQVRINVRFYEVNRSRIRSYAPNFGLFSSSLIQNPLQSANSGAASEQDQTLVTGGGRKNAVQTVLSFLGGALTSEAQFSSSHFAINAALSYLERVGIARSLSSPSLTVLSGEVAQFQVGGQIPLPQAFIPAFTNGAAANNGVYNSVVFEEFGVRLGVRPLVDENDAVTIDVAPQITTPNAELTAAIRSSTGTNQATTAFSTRSLRTSARLGDGQSLLVGGLLTRQTADSRNGTPGLQDTPGVGWLFKDFNKSDNTQELIIVVNPVVLREKVTRSMLWAFPDTTEFLRFSFTAP